VISAHSAIVCTRSPVLAAALDGKFQVTLSREFALHMVVTRGKEATSREIHLPDDEPSIVAKMVDFLYSSDYDDNADVPAIHRAGSTLDSPPLSSKTQNDRETVGNISTNSAQPLEYNPRSMLVNTKVYIIADKYGIPALKDRATEKFNRGMKISIHMGLLARSIRLLYENTMDSDRMLRDLIIQQISRSLGVFLKSKSIVKVLMDYPGLGIEVLEAVRKMQDKDRAELKKGSSQKRKLSALSSFRSQL
jgi:hypothetical protein